MALAVILSFCIIPCAPASPASTATRAPSARVQSESRPSDSAAQQNNTAEPKSQTNPAATSPAPATAPKPKQDDQKPSAAAKRKRGAKNKKKKTASTGCADSASAANPAPADAAASAAGTNAAAPTASECPPSKKVIRNGGTAEPAIQLTGSANSDQASYQRSTTQQLLGSAEENLKKASGRELNSSQQEMVKQIQQFVEQSKVAVAAGDIERGHTLAQKAQLLSDELIKPQ